MAPPTFRYVFTLHVDLAPALDIGATQSGDRRFIPITGGTFEGPNISGIILPYGGDWNAVQKSGVVHVFAKYIIQTSDGTNISVTNEGYGRASQADMHAVFHGEDPSKVSTRRNEADNVEGSGWYTKTWPRFEVAEGEHDWLNKSCFVGDLLPPLKPGQVKIEVYEIL